jgi:hypothetical protein
MEKKLPSYIETFPGRFELVEPQKPSLIPWFGLVIAFSVSVLILVGVL